MSSPDPQTHVQLDATGLRCPLPIIRLAVLARTQQPGTVIQISTTDPAAGPDLRAWCRMLGHTLLSQEPQSEAEVLVSRIQVQATAGA